MNQSHVCPWWIGYFLLSPLRKLVENPTKMFAPYIEPGMTALDVGCAMGYFSLPLARAVGEEGHVICVDLQERMLQTLRKRAARHSLLDRLDLRLCSAESLGLDDAIGQIDFIAAMHVIHELPNPETTFAELFNLAKSGGLLYLSEPTGHVDRAAFERTIALAQRAGFDVVERPTGPKSLRAVLKKPASPA